VKKITRNTLISIIVIAILGILFVASMFMYWYQVRIDTNELISQQVVELQQIFKKIDEAAGIVDFDHQKSYIDFLNVGSFSGSEVGAMNLRNPKKWQGPYLKENPTIQEQNYQIVRTKKGFFIVPGDGVVLSNGKIIGKDIIFDENADIPAMMSDPTMLNFQNKALAAPLQMSGQKMPDLLIDTDTFDVGSTSEIQPLTVVM
jgi:type II secretory pathway pseudopilin PulG